MENELINQYAEEFNNYLGLSKLFNFNPISFNEWVKFCCIRDLSIYQNEK